MDRVLTLLALLFLVAVPLVGCADGDIRVGCERYCRCHRGSQSEGACRSDCRDTLTSLKKRDRARARQVADCLAAKGKRPCKELALCASGVLRKH
jgi:hypothetical protein